MRASRAKVTSNGRINPETFRFFRDLSRNNAKQWMDENRERYQSAIVQPFRGLLEELTPAVRKLYPGFDVGGRTGVNFSRINRDIRFAKDKTPYRPQMYLLFPHRGGKNRRPGELYVGVTADVVTAGFRAYFDRDTKASALASRIPQAPKWCAQHKRRMARQYESYWYSMEKGEWTKNDGWPLTPEEWKKLRAWIVRRKLSPAAAARPSFLRDVVNIFRQVLPIFRFVSHSN
ncbi:MAG: hypothetical protein DMG30_15900 [Acidobacteria bacterium]|nr:MAG: hypothetical protein DMG30_15900 [Acidobacteriota bacterium]